MEDNCCYACLSRRLHIQMRGCGLSCTQLLCWTGTLERRAFPRGFSPTVVCLPKHAPHTLAWGRFTWYDSWLCKVAVTLPCAVNSQAFQDGRGSRENFYASNFNLGTNKQRYILVTDRERLVHAFILSRLGCFNTVFTGLSKTLSDRCSEDKKKL